MVYAWDVERSEKERTMKYSNLLKIGLRILGVYFVTVLLSYLNYGLSSFLYISKSDLILSFLIPFLMYLFFVYFLLFKTDGVIQLLNLKDGIQDEEEGESSFSSDKLLELGVTFLGIYLIVLAIPEFIASFIVTLIKTDSEESLSAIMNILKPFKVDGAFFYTHLFQLIIGVLLIKYSKRLVAYIHLKSLK